jgi:hypothetical protein
MTEVSKNSPQENSQQRYERWVTRNDRDADTGRRRFKFIAGFIGVGVVTWLFWTL